MTLPKTFIIAGLSICLLNVAGCVDWQSTPVTVDKYQGMAVKNMMANQTLYPEHSQQPRQVLLIDGQKAQTIINSYRLPPTAKGSVSSGKAPVNVDVNNR
jgi:hypothetical protein